MTGVQLAGNNGRGLVLGWRTGSRFAWTTAVMMRMSTPVSAMMEIMGGARAREACRGTVVPMVERLLSGQFLFPKRTAPPCQSTAVCKGVAPLARVGRPGARTTEPELGGERAIWSLRCRSLPDIPRRRLGAD